MSMLDVHQNALKKINEAHHNFLLRYKAAAKAIYGFIEGKQDPMFYKSMIEALIPGDWSAELFACGGKDKVFEVYNSLDWTLLSKRRVCFFVDRDLSFYEGAGQDVADTNIFTTEGYSIENDILSAGLFQRLAHEVFNLSNLEVNEEESLTQLFEQQSSGFMRDLIPMMAQMLIWRRGGVTAPLNNLDLKDLFDVALGSLSKKYPNKYELVSVMASRVGAPCANDQDLDAAEAEFMAPQEHLSFVRGKYLLWFLAKFLSSIHENAPAFSAKSTRPPKMSVTVGPNNIVMFAAPRARASERLRTFIGSNYLAFIATSSKEKQSFWASARAAVMPSGFR